MADIVEIIQRLTLEVTGQQGLDKIISGLQAQAENIDKLKGKLGDLQKYYDTAQNVQQQQRAQDAITKTTSAIDRQTAALEKNFNGNAKLQQAINEELGLMQQLSQFIAQHTKERETLTDVSQIQQYTAEIKAAQAELRSLTTPLNLIGDRPNAGAIEALQQRQRILQSTIPTLPVADIRAAEAELAKVKVQLTDLQAIGKEPIINIQQAGAIEAIELRIKQLNNAIRTAPADNASGLLQYSKGGSKEYIASLNNELAKTQIKLNDLKNSGKEPIVNIRQVGAIEALNSRLTILKNTLKTVPKDNIAGVNQEIIKTQKELAQLNSLGASSSGFKGVIAQLFGVSSEGGLLNQIGKGLIRGAGIGLGFQIIPGLISQLEKYVIALTHVDETEQKATESAKTFGETILKQIEELTQLNQLTRDIVNVGDAQAKRDIAGAKAIGIVKGEQFESNKRIFESEQAQRIKERQDIIEHQDFLAGLSNANVAAGPSGNFQKVIDNPGKFDVSTQITDVLKQKIIAAKKDGISLKDLYIQIDQEVIKQKELNDEKLKNLDAATKAAEIERVSKLNESIFQLNKKLNDQLVQLKNDALQKSVSYQAQYQDDLNNLILAGEIQQAQELRKFDEDKEKERQQLALKGQRISIETEELYRKNRLAIVEEYSQKEFQIISQFTQRRIDAENKVADLLLQTQGNGLKDKNTTNAASGVPGINSILQEQEVIGALALSKQAEQHDKELTEAKKFNQDTRELEIQQGIEEKNLIDRLNREKLDKQLKYYSDLLSLVKSKANSRLLQLLADPTAQGGNASSFLNGNESAGRFRSRIPRSNFKDTQAQIDQNISGKNNEIDQAKKNQDNIINNPDATAADVQKIDDEVNKLQGDLQKLNIDKASSIADEQKRQIEQIIGLYDSLAQSAASAYNAIAEARQKDLDREINVREQRVSVALKLAERGNTEILGIENEKLKAAQAQKRKDALEQMAINAALTESNLIAAAAKAILEYDIFSPAAIAAIFAAMAGAIGSAVAISKASETTGFWKGGYTGDGNKYDVAGPAHKGEFVFNQEKTREFRPLFESIHKGNGIPLSLMPQYLNSNAGVNKTEFAELKNAVFSVVDAVNGKTVNAIQVMDKTGLSQSIVEHQTKDRIKYRA